MTNDPKDWHVMAAVVRGRADVIATSNVRGLSPRRPGNVIHNFLPDRPSRKSYNSPGDEKQPRPKSKRGATERSSKSSPSSARKSRPQKRKGRRPTLTRKIEDLDREFDQLSRELKAAMLEYRAAAGPGRKVRPPSDLLHQWKSAKAELKSLLAKAFSKGLVLPPNLSIHEVLAQEARLAEKPAREYKLTRAKPPTTVGGISGYYGGPSRTDPPRIQRLPANVEARLAILRNRQRAAAHAMRDRSKSRAEREAAELAWARARQEADKLERQTVRN